jgi:hypothetical protein
MFNIENSWEIKEQLTHIPIWRQTLCELSLCPAPPARYGIDVSAADSSLHEEQHHLGEC